MEATTTMEQVNGHAVETMTEEQLAGHQPLVLQPNHSKGWTDVDKAYVLKHWREGRTQDDIDKHKEIAKHVGRTVAATYQMYHSLTSDKSKRRTEIKNVRGNKRLIHVHSPNLTYEEERTILETFGSFTHEMKAIVLALRNYERPKIIHMDHEAGRLMIDFYPNSK